MDDLEKMVRENQSLVYLVVNRSFPEYMFDDDVIQEGMIGLWQAAKTYDQSKAKFSTYAVPAIQHNIGMYLKKQKPSPFVSLDDCDIYGELLPYTSFEYVDLDGWMSTLRPEVQRMVYMRIRGFTTEEVAKVSGCTRQNVSIALKRCRGTFDEYI